MLSVTEIFKEQGKQIGIPANAGDRLKSDLLNLAPELFPLLNEITKNFPQISFSLGQVNGSKSVEIYSSIDDHWLVLSGEQEAGKVPQPKVALVSYGVEKQNFYPGYDREWDKDLVRAIADIAIGRGVIPNPYDIRTDSTPTVFAAGRPAHPRPSSFAEEEHLYV